MHSHQRKLRWHNCEEQLHHHTCAKSSSTGGVLHVGGSEGVVVAVHAAVTRSELRSH